MRSFPRLIRAILFFSTGDDSDSVRGGKATLTTPPAKEKRKNFFKKPVNDFDSRIAMSVTTPFFFIFYFFYVYTHTLDIVIASTPIWISNIYIYTIVVESAIEISRSQVSSNVFTKRSSFDRPTSIIIGRIQIKIFRRFGKDLVVCDVIKLDDVDEAYVSKFICRC